MSTSGKNLDDLNDKSDDLLNTIKDINEAKEESNRLDSDAISMSSALVDSMKELLDVSFKRSTFDNNILKLNKSLFNSISDQKTGLQGIDVTQKQIAKNQDLLNKAKRNEVGITSSLGENEKERVKTSLNLADSLASSLAKEQELTNAAAQGISITEQQLKLAKEATIEAEVELAIELEQLSATGRQAVFTRQNIQGLENQNKLRKTELKQQEAINKAMGLGGNTLKGIEGLLKKIGMGGLASKLGLDKANDKMKSFATAVTRGGTKTATLSQKFKILGSGVKSMGGSLVENLTDPLSLSIGAATALFKALKSSDEAISKMAKGMNMTYSEAKSLKTSLSTAAAASENMLVTGKGMAESHMAINSALGTNVKLNEENLVAFTSMRDASGMTNAELMGMQSIVNATGGDLEEMTGQFMAQARLTSTKYKVSLNEKKLMGEIGKISKATTLSLGKDHKLIAKTVSTVMSLGMEMSKVEGIAGSLLDFESSIENELQAELLLGKDINLEKARQAALDNDLATVAKEIANQVGSSAEFGEMNRLQQEALAKAVGMSKEELASTLFLQEQLKNVGKDDVKIKEDYINGLQKKGLSQDEIKKELQKTSIDQMKEQAGVADRLNATVSKMQEMFAGMAGPLLEGLIPAIELVGTLLTPILHTVGAFASIITGSWGDLDGMGKTLGIIGVSLAAIVATSKIYSGIQMVISANKAAQSALTKGESKNIFKTIGALTIQLGIEMGIMSAKMASNAALTFGIGVAVAVAAAAAGYAAIKGLTGDDVMSPGANAPSGYGKRTLFDGENKINLNDNDTVIAGTKLFGDQGSINPHSKQQPMVQQIQTSTVNNNESSNRTNELLEQILSKNGEVTMDSTQVGTSFAMGTYSVQ